MHGLLSRDVFLVILATLLLEVALIRVPSFPIWYCFSHVVVATAFLGYGASGRQWGIEGERIPFLPTGFDRVALIGRKTALKSPIRFARRGWPSIVAVCVLGAALPTQAVRVVWETGSLIGSYHARASPECVGFSGSSDGTFEFEDGEESVAGVDYSAANPGTFEVCVEGAETGTWSGEFSARNLVFGTTEGTYERSPGPVAAGMTLKLAGPLSFSPRPPLSPLPPELSDLRFEATMTVIRVWSSLMGYDFLGSFILTAEVPSVCGDGLATGEEACDDGNTASGDCCSAVCRPEPYGQVCDVGPGGICDGLGACIDPENLPPLIYFSTNIDGDIGVCGTRGGPAGPAGAVKETPSVRLALDPLEGDLYGSGPNQFHPDPLGWEHRLIWRMPLDGAPAEVVRDLGPARFHDYDVAVDPVRRQLYWTDVARPSISRLSLTDANDFDPDFVRLAAMGFAVNVNPADGRLYWVDQGGIKRSNVDGTGIETVLAGSYGDIAIDPLQGKLYFSVGVPGPEVFSELHRSRLDGSGIETVGGTDVDPIRLLGGLAVDPDDQVLYAGEQPHTEGGLYYHTRVRRIDLVSGQTGYFATFGPLTDVVVDPRFVTRTGVPAGAPVMGVVLGGPAKTGGVAVVFERSEGGKLAAEYERIPRGRLREEAGIEAGAGVPALGSDPVQLWRLYFRGRASGEAQVEVTYDGAHLRSGLAERDLALSAWDGERLVLLPGEVDETANRIRASSATAFRSPAGFLLPARGPRAAQQAVLVLTARKRLPWWWRLWPR